MFLIKKADNPKADATEQRWLVGYFMPKEYVENQGYGTLWYTIEVCDNKLDAARLTSFLNGGDGKGPYRSDFKT